MKLVEARNATALEAELMPAGTRGCLMVAVGLADEGAIWHLRIAGGVLAVGLVGGSDGGELLRVTQQARQLSGLRQLEVDLDLDLIPSAGVRWGWWAA